MSLPKGTSAKLVTLTKAMILKALKTENLIATTWVTSKNKKICGVCAVGSVVRQLGVKDATKISNACDSLVSNGYTDDESEINDTLDNGDYLSALSMKFEMLSKKVADTFDTQADKLTPVQMYAVREHLITWVKNEFPNKIGKFKVVKEQDFYGKKVERYELERA